VDKIKTIDDLASIIAMMKENGAVIAHCHGVFDHLHPGHVRHLQAAKLQGTVLAVTVTPDRFVNKGPGRPVFNETLRAESIAALECVDFVAINEWPTAVETIYKLEPDFYIKGSDYANREDDPTGMIYEEQEAVESIGGRIYFTNELSFSTTELLGGKSIPEKAQEFLKQFRKVYSANEVIQKIKDLAAMKVLVIGDAINDVYNYCEAMAKSPKESVVSTKFLTQESFIGGALIVANHIAGFCDQVTLVTCIGGEMGANDRYISSQLRENVGERFFKRNDAPTIEKHRFVDPFLRKLFAIQYLNDSPLPPDVESEVIQYLQEHIEEYDLVVVADFGHGFIGRELIELVCGRSRFLAATVQTNSANIGFNLITKYPRIDYACLDTLETRLACHDRYGKLEELVPRIGQLLHCSNISVTRGNDGALTYQEGKGFFEIPPLTNNAVDSLGAGDAFLSLTAPCVAKRYPMDLVGFIGNAAGALHVQVVGNKEPISQMALFKFIRSVLK
jgi:cytidyltransferase-like protein